MAASNKPMGILPNGDQRNIYLENFFIDVKRWKITHYYLSHIQIETPTSNTGGTVSGMVAFNGVIKKWKSLGKE